MRKQNLKISGWELRIHKSFLKKGIKQYVPKQVRRGGLGTRVDRNPLIA